MASNARVWLDGMLSSSRHGVAFDMRIRESSRARGRPPPRAGETERDRHRGDVAPHRSQSSFYQICQLAVGHLLVTCDLPDDLVNLARIRGVVAHDPLFAFFDDADRSRRHRVIDREM